MSDNKELSNKLTKEDKEREKEQNKIIKASKSSSKTNILHTIKFNNELDKQVFDMLPLSDAQKEELILSCEFNTDLETITDKDWDGRLSPVIPEGLNGDVEETNLFDIKQEVGEELELECVGGCDIKKNIK